MRPARISAVLGAFALLAGLALWGWPDDGPRPGPERPALEAPPVPVEPEPAAPARPRPGRVFGAVLFADAGVAGASVHAALARGPARAVSDDCTLPSVCPLTCDEPAPLQSTITDAHGHFALDDLPSGPFSVWAEHARGAVVHVGVAAGGAPLALTLVPWREVSGRIEAEEGPPVAHARVRAIAHDRSRQVVTTTAEDGHFHLKVAAMGYWVVAASAAGFAVESDVLAPAQTAWNPVLESDPALTLTGRVTLRDQPFEGAKVTFRTDDCSVEAVSARDGTFQFGPLSANANHAVRAESGPLAVARVLDLDEATHVELPLAEPTSVHGLVRDAEGRPIAGAALELEDDPVTATTDLAGKFALQTSLAGPWRLTARADGYFAQDVETKTARTVISLVRAAAVRGVVKTAAGALLPGARVAVSIERTDSDDEATTGPDGAFALDVTEGTALTLTATHPDHAPGSTRTPVPAHGVVITMKPGVTLHGQVLDADGTPFDQAVVTAVGPGDPRALSGPDGGFVFRGLVAGPYRFVAVTQFEEDLREVAARAIVPTHAPLVLRFAAGGSIRGMVRDRAGVPVARVEVSATRLGRPTETDEERATTSRADGTFELKNLLPGTYVLAPSRAGYSGRLVHAEVGDLQVALTVQRETVVSGRVVTPAATPVRAFELWEERRVGGRTAGTLTDRVEGADGRFTTPVGGADFLVIRAPGFAPFDVPLAGQPEGRVALGDLILVSLRDVTVTVVDDATSEPIARAWVSVDRGPGPAQAGDGGVVRLEGVDPGPVSVRVSPPTQPMQVLAVPAGVTSATLRYKR